MEKAQAVTIINFSSSRFRSAYSPRLSISLTCPQPGRTKQSFKDECDINHIMARYQRTGVLDHLRADVQTRYADVTAMDYQEAMDTVANANSAFQALPSSIRSRFDNDPAKLLDFVHDPRNRDEAVKLGFLDASKLPAGWGEPQPKGEADEPKGSAA